MRFITISMLAASFQMSTFVDQDPHGFQEARWGMTVQQVRRLYPKAHPIIGYTADMRRPSQGVYYPIWTGSIQVNGHSWNLTFGFDAEDSQPPRDYERGTLFEVRLAAVGDSAELGAAARSTDAALTAKYGKGKTKASSSTVNSTPDVYVYTAWQLPATTIDFTTLARPGTTGPILSQVVVGYTRRFKPAQIPERGDISEARRILQQVRQVADELTAATARGSEKGGIPWSQIAGAMTRAGDVKGALQLVGTIQDEGKEQTLYEIARTQAESGDLKGAFEIAGSIKRDFLKVHALVAIAQAQAKAADRTGVRITLQEARDIANDIEGQDRAFALNVLRIFEPSPPVENQEERAALAQAKAGDINGAIKTLTAIQDNHARSLAVERLAVSQAKAGDVNGALRLAESIPAQWLFIKARTLEQITGIQASAGNTQEALRIANTIPEDEADSSSSKTKALIAVAAAQAKAGLQSAALTNLLEAVRVSEAIENRMSPFKATLLSVVAIAQGNLGDHTAALTFQRSLQVAETTSADRAFGPFSEAWALREIAGAQAGAGNFKAALQAAETLRGIPPPKEPLNEYTRDYKFWILDTVHGIATTQALKGDTKGALAWASELSSPIEKIHALLGAAEGMLQRSDAEPAPSAKPRQ